MTNKYLVEAWDKVADALETNPMRPVRYGKCFRYLRDVGRDSQLLEVGCGEGTGLLIARHLGFKNIVRIEVSKERLKSAKGKLGNQASLILVPPDSHLPFSDGYFDIVVSAAVIEHTVDPEYFVREIARVVRPGGYIIISSDCYQWRILQLLGIYQSTQPIDKALFPTRLFRFFKDSGLQLIHCEGFPWPEQKFRFLRMIVRHILLHIRWMIGYITKQPIIRWGVRILKKFTKSCRTPMLDSYQSNKKTNQQSKLNYIETSDRFINETWTLRRNVWSFFKLIFSDENVFFLVKQNEHQKGC